jgi:hypothetical protein
VHDDDERALTSAQAPLPDLEQAARAVVDAGADSGRSARRSRAEVRLAAG